MTIKNAPPIISNLLQVNAETFESTALATFAWQYEHNPLYRNYCNLLKTNVQQIDSFLKIPFLPISFFKTHQVLTNRNQEPQLIFESSGTTGETPSRHFVTDAALYDQSLLNGFRQFYGNPADYVILALLPSYLERKNASLVYMAKKLMDTSRHPLNGFYINEWDLLGERLNLLIQEGQKVLLLGVTFALLDFAERYPMPLKNTIVMETGGMKGRHEEWTRAQVHDFLKNKWSLAEIHSEYGMTELLSQAYSTSAGQFRGANTMQVLCRDINDPFDIKPTGSGAINIIDLANINSCAFIATDDVGSVHKDGAFEITGRLDFSALRGCSLMAI